MNKIITLFLATLLTTSCTQLDYTDRLIYQRAKSVFRLSGFGSGTGFLVKKKSKYYVLTNAHVCEGNVMFNVTNSYTESSYSGSVYKVSANADLCAVKLFEIPTEKHLIITRAEPDLFEPHFYMGYPGPLLTLKLTKVRFIGKRKGLFHYDEAIMPGSSGSPVFDSRGYVIAVMNSGLFVSVFDNFRSGNAMVSLGRDSFAVENKDLVEFFGEL